ncbi:hypothetical protein D8674_004129 [Pyrus ussuriensis x Pyrus communis]|uniref:Uncharacterized protein n=1 Tax=Pyrus ussuriensis x Pyrus communis TaxID=2448454 RepID=A0A5N5FXV5_9ROSA|nr:hypothetical protein D8674_004129 [Pyrus ussuriensis x Pyrus communis]
MSMHSPRLLTMLGKLSSAHFFVKHHANSKRPSLIATMHNTLILVTEFMCVDQDTVKYAIEVEVALMAQLRPSAVKIEKLESELAFLKGSDVSAPISMQLKNAH